MWPFAGCVTISADSAAQHSTARHGTAQHSTAQHGTARHGTARHGTARHGTARHGTARHSTAQHSTAQHSTAVGSRSQHNADHTYKHLSCTECSSVPVQALLCSQQLLLRVCLASQSSLQLLLCGLDLLLHLFMLLLEFCRLLHVTCTPQTFCVRPFVTTPAIVVQALLQAEQLSFTCCMRLHVSVFSSMPADLYKHLSGCFVSVKSHSKLGCSYSAHSRNGRSKLG